jgi:hypothetical protein
VLAARTRMQCLRRGLRRLSAAGPRNGAAVVVLPGAGATRSGGESPGRQ